MKQFGRFFNSKYFFTFQTHYIATLGFFDFIILQIFVIYAFLALFTLFARHFSFKLQNRKFFSVFLRHITVHDSSIIRNTITRDYTQRLTSLDCGVAGSRGRFIDLNRLKPVRTAPNRLKLVRNQINRFTRDS